MMIVVMMVVVTMVVLMMIVVMRAVMVIIKRMGKRMVDSIFCSPFYPIAESK